MNDDTKMRVFFALWPSATECEGLAKWQTALKNLCGGRIMRPDTLHVTLVFLGDVAVDRLNALKLAAEEVSAARFSVQFDEARYWGHNHILYAVLGEVPPELAQLVLGLEKHLIRHHFKFEQREYKPHVTLLRNVHWNDDILPKMPPVRWKCRDFVLLQSQPLDGGANYRVLARFSLSDMLS